MIPRRGLSLTMATAVLAITPVWLSCDEAPIAEPQPPAVTVASPLVLEVVQWDEYTGQLVATDHVEIRSRVSGYLQSIHFTEGQVVEKDALLFVIDPRPFEAALQAAEADRDQAKARLALARNDRERADRLIKRRAISEEEFDGRVTGLADAEAAFQSAEASVRSARLNLEFTQVRSPIRGRAGRHVVTEGNLVNAGGAQSSLLTTVVTEDPIHCYFEADERAFLKYTRMNLDGTRGSSRENPNPVFMALADEQGFPHRGYMDFVDNVLDSSTGTVTGRAVFQNPRGVLAPGLFGRLRLLGSGRFEAMLIPDSAVGTDQSERFVVVVGGDGVAERRSVETGTRVRGLRVVRSGLEANERIVLRGLQRVRLGQEVVATEGAIEPEPEMIALDDVFPPTRSEGGEDSETGSGES